MKTTFLKYAAPVALCFALGNAAQAATAKSSCFLFCSGDRASSAKSADAQKTEPAQPGVPGDLESAISQAQSARKAGDLTGAAKILSQLVLFAADDPRVLGEYGKTLAAQGRTDDALAFLERAIQLLPGDWSLYSAQGVAYDQKGAYQAAQASYAQALALKPGEPIVLNNAALSHMQSGDLDGAEELLQQASPGTPDYPRIAQNLTLVQKLKAARPAAPPPPPVAVASVPPVAEAVPAPQAPPAIAANPAPAIVQTPIAQAPIAQTPIESAPLAPPAPQVTEQVAPPPAPQAAPSEPPKRSLTLAELQADPTVRMAPIPKAQARALPRAKPAVAKPAVAPGNPAIAENANPLPRHVTSANATYYVQAGAYASQERAGKLAASLDSLGARVSPATVAGQALYRVRIGPFLDVGQANAAISQARSMGQADLRIVSE
jgi:Flp pilus assembly protein TadD